MIYQLKIRDRGTVFRGEDVSTRSATFPSICVLSDGRWLCSLRVAPDKVRCAGERVFLTWSDDQGATWSPAIAPFVPPVIDGRPGNFRVGPCSSLPGGGVVVALAWVDQSRPERPLFDDATSSLLDMKMFIARSHDRGETWSGCEQIPRVPSDASTPLTGGILPLADGIWICPYETNKPYDREGEWIHTSRLLFSRDEGRSWADPVIVTDSEKGIFFWDQRLSLRPDGSLMNVFWTYDNTNNRYINIHAACSEDGGRSWSAPWDIGVPGQPAAISSVPGGPDVLVFVDRSGIPELKARLSVDEGKSWPVDQELLLASAQTRKQTIEKGRMADAWTEMSAFSMGLPGTALCSGGDVLVVYYSGETAERTSIHWIRLGVESSR